MRVDAHHHLWDLSVRDQPWTAGMPALRRNFSVDDLRPELASAGIDATVVVQTVGVLAETVLGSVSHKVLHEAHCPVVVVH